MRALWSSTQVGSKVAALIVMWSLAMRDLGVDELGPEAFAAWSREATSTVYRRLEEFRACWPEYRNPSVLALQVLEAADRQSTKPGPLLPVSL
jgi:hypothetical protein